ncbi:MAG: hypothetical protein JW836_13240, partial [Deltaproteobacteria bacterium]|nr:hypothetical protein [Deltaproteobacteria bacterium]
MKECIDLSDICSSPHRAPYEEFIQIDRLKRNQPFDPSQGLYQQVSTIFPIFHRHEEAVIATAWIYPELQKKQTPRPEDIKKAVEGQFEEGNSIYAGQDVTLPGDSRCLVRAGKRISPEVINRIVRHNCESLSGQKKPLKRLVVLNPKEDAEREILAEFVKKKNFNPSQLRRNVEREIHLKGYSLRLPSLLDQPETENEWNRMVQLLSTTCRDYGKSLEVQVLLDVLIKEKVTFFFNGKAHEVGEKESPRKAPLVNLPLFTPKETFRINGLERVPVCQLLPRPGVHFLKEEREPDSTPLLSLHVRPERGPFLNFKIPLKARATPGPIRVEVGRHDFDFIDFAKAMGFLDKVKGLAKKAEVPMPPPRGDIEALSPLMSRIYGQLFQGKDGYDLSETGRQAISKRLAKYYVKCGVSASSERCLQHEDIAAMLVFLIEASRSGSPHVDDPMDLSTRKIYTISDQIQDRMALLLPWIQSRIRFFMRTRKDIEDIPLTFSGAKGKVSKNVGALFHGELCQICDDTNPLAELSLKRKVTFLGPRGIQQTHGSFERRGVHFSHYGRLCLTETPESENIGFNLYLALAAKVQDGAIKAPFIADKRSNGTTKWLSPDQERGKRIAPRGAEEFPDPAGNVLVRDGTARCVKPIRGAKITLRDKYRGQFLGLGANLVPLVQHNDNNRVMMGAKNMKQAVPLLFPEEPLIKTGGEELVARLSGHAILALSDGIVESVTEQAITLRNSQGKLESYWLSALNPTFCNTLTYQRPLVKKGDRVGRNQPLADGACTRNGHLALGANLLTAYMPYYGLNFEDGMVISDRLVKEDILTSLHVSAHVFEVYGDEWMSSKDMEKALQPFSMFGGVLCREGQAVSRGDRLLGKYRRDGKKIRTQWLHSPVSGTVVHLIRQDIEPQTASERRVRCRWICYILEERKISIGDKLMGRHGNKGVVARIIPSEQMPHLVDGTPVDIILNPHGVISRMNLGQILETHLGWIVKHGGEKYQNFSIIAPFEKIWEEDINEAFKSLAHTGINEEGKALLIDGRSKQLLRNPVTVGYQYIMKLNHLVDDKINIRETAAYTLLTRQPVKGRKRKGGQRMGEMEIWALQAHLARHLIKESMTFKSDALEIRVRDLSAKYFNQESPLIKTTPIQETLRATAMLLRGLCFEVTLQNGKRKPIPFDKKDLSAVESMKIRLAEGRTIKKWAKGRKVTDPRFPSVKRGKVIPVLGGLFDRKIFRDPRKDMAYIELAEPVIHPLYLSHFRSRMSALSLKKKKPPLLESVFRLNKPQDVVAAVDYQGALIRGPDDFDCRIVDRRDFYQVPLTHKSICCHCSDAPNREAGGTVCAVCGKPFKSSPAYTSFQSGALLAKEFLKKQVKGPLSRALLTNIPVLPTDFRPLSARHGEIEMRSELNDFYRAVLEADSSLRRALEAKPPMPERSLFYLRARLHTAVRRLMIGDEETAREGMRSIGDRIKGKEGILRMYHLGKRVDVSARSAIVPMPELALDQVGIPLEMAAGLMRSRLISSLAEKMDGVTLKERRGRAEVYLNKMDEPIAREMIRQVLFGQAAGLLSHATLILTRAPSLHKYNVLAFRPVCVEHHAIGLHPLTCKYFNADFDGDQMGVFLPLSKQALAEAEKRLSPLRNLLSAANGKAMLHFDQDVVLGIYLLTSDPKGRKIFNEWFKGA